MSGGSPINLIAERFKSDTQKYAFFTLAVLSSLACAISSSLHYTNTFYANKVMAIGWALSMLFLLAAFIPDVEGLQKEWKHLTTRNYALLLGFLALLFFASHLWNFSNAPWNRDGLFDDAAWDIYFCKRYILSDQPFQAAFFDMGVSREAVYHYYLAAIFKLFGFNLLVFNIGLIVLGFITFFFTALLVHKLFNNYIVTVVTAVVFNFLPIHFMHTFCGHRYAIAAPLMMSSLYFLYTGYKSRSNFRLALGAILGGLCVAGAIMGKQYLMGLVAAVVVYLILDFKKTFTAKNWDNTKLVAVGFIIALIPLIVYIYYNPVYFAHEQALSSDFINGLKNSGISGISKNIEAFKIVMFGDYSPDRWFIMEFVPIPFVYYIFLIPGILFAFLKKRYEIIFLAIIPMVGAFVSSGYSDYRILHAAPLWAVLMAFTFNEILNIHKNKKISKYIPRYATLGLAMVILLFGWGPCVKYIYGKAKDPNSMWYLPHKDVAISRYLRDIVAGVPNPSPAFRWQEFNKLEGVKEPNYDTLICQNLGFAITHLFLADYDDKKILSMSNQMPFATINTDSEILTANRDAIMQYKKTSKDLKLIWEIDPKTNRIIQEYKKLNYLGNDQVLSSSYEGQDFSFYVLNIKNENIDQLKEKVISIRLP